MRRSGETNISAEQQEKEIGSWISKKEKLQERQSNSKEEKGERQKEVESLKVMALLSMRYKSADPISTTSFIEKLQQEGAQEVGRFIVLKYSKGGTDSVHGAFIVSAKVGPSVVRNKVKRQLREIFRNKLVDILEPGFFLFIAKKCIVDAKFAQLENDILDLIVRISKIRR